jgi:hypothetical protein
MLSQRANELVGMKIHPTSIISGFRLAQKEAVKYINERLSVKVRCAGSAKPIPTLNEVYWASPARQADKLGREVLINVAKTSMSSKILNIDSDFFAALAVCFFVCHLLLSSTLLTSRRELNEIISLRWTHNNYGLLLHLLLSTSTWLQVDAVQMVKMTTGAGETKYPIKAINILKVITFL